MHIRYLVLLFLCVWMFVPVHAELIPDSTWTFHQPEAHHHAEENEIWLSADRPGAGTGSEVLGKGVSNATPGRQLCSLLGITPRELTKAVENERRSGQPICASSDSSTDVRLSSSMPQSGSFRHATHSASSTWQ